MRLSHPLFQAALNHTPKHERNRLERALSRARARLEGDPENLERLRDLADALYTLGDLLLEQGAVDEGRCVMEEGVEAARAVCARVPEESRAADWLCLAYEGVADAWRELGEYARSLEAAELGLEASLALVARDPADAWQRRLAAAYEKVANVLGNERVDEALEMTRRCLAIRLGLCEREPTNTRRRFELSIAYERLAKLGRKARCFEEADAALQRCIEVREELCALEPNNMDACRSLATAYAQKASHTRPAVLQLVVEEKALRLRLEVVRREPLNLSAQHELACSYHEMAQAQHIVGDRARALALAELGLAIAEKLVRDAPGHADSRHTLACLLFMATRACDGDVPAQRARSLSLLVRAEEVTALLHEDARNELRYDIESGRRWRLVLESEKG